VGNDESIQNLGKKLNLVERILNKSIFYDFKVNNVLITFLILSYIAHINNYNEMLLPSVTWLHSSVGRAFSLNFTFSITFLSKFTDPGSNPLEGMAGGHFDLPMPPHFDLYHSFIHIRLKSVHFKKTVARISFLSKLWYFLF
jgi:hypothetical protein